MHKAITLGGPGAEPPGVLSSRLGEDGQGVDAGEEVLVVLLGGQLHKVPLSTVVVVVVHPVIDPCEDSLEGLALGDESGDLVLHVAEEALLWGVVPAVAAAGHGLDEGSVLQLLDEGVAGVVAALVGVDDDLVIQGTAVFPDELVDRVEDEVHLETEADLPGQDLVGEGVENGGEIASAVPEEQVGDICQQDLAGRLSEPAVHEVGSDVAGGEGLGHATIGIGLADLAVEIELAHQAADLLDVHDDAGLVQQTHMNAPGSLVVAAKAVGFKDEVEVPAIRLLPGLADGFGGAPVVVTRPGDVGDPAHGADLEEVVVAARGLADDGEFHFWRSLDSHDFRASKSAV